MSDATPTAAPPAAAPPGPTPQAVRTPAWQLRIQGADVTEEIAHTVRSVTYTDHVHGESDELEIEIADPTGVWRGPWCPDKGDPVDLVIGYQGVPLLPCGRFQVDEFEAAGGSGGGDTFTIRALAAGHVPNFRTRRSQAYEGQTLRQVVNTVAARHNLRVVGELGEERIGRVTQNRQSDVAFLTRLAEQFGYVFSIRGDQLVFHKLATLEAGPATFGVHRKEVLEYRLKGGSTGVYRSATISYHDAQTNTTLTKTVQAEGVSTGNDLVISRRVESVEQAEQVAAAELRRQNSRGTEGTVVVSGEPRLVAGANGDLVGFGRFDGRYTIITSKHSLTRDGGYTTEIEVRTVGSVQPRRRQNAASRTRNSG